MPGYASNVTIVGHDRSCCNRLLDHPSKDGPGPLVSAIAGPGNGGYAIPVTVVPGDLADETIDALA